MPVYCLSSEGGLDELCWGQCVFRSRAVLPHVREFLSDLQGYDKRSSDVSATELVASFMRNNPEAFANVMNPDAQADVIAGEAVAYVVCTPPPFSNGPPHDAEFWVGIPVPLGARMMLFVCRWPQHNRYFLRHVLPAAEAAAWSQFRSRATVYVAPIVQVRHAVVVAQGLLFCVLVVVAVHGGVFVHAVSRAYRLSQHMIESGASIPSPVALGLTELGREGAFDNAVTVAPLHAAHVGLCVACSCVGWLRVSGSCLYRPGCDGTMTGVLLC